MKRVLLILASIVSLFVISCGASATKPEELKSNYINTTGVSSGYVSQVSGNKITVGDFAQYGENVTKIEAVIDNSTQKQITFTEVKNKDQDIVELQNINAASVTVYYSYTKKELPKGMDSYEVNNNKYDTLTFTVSGINDRSNPYTYKISAPDNRIINNISLTSIVDSEKVSLESLDYTVDIDNSTYEVRVAVNNENKYKAPYTVTLTYRYSEIFYDVNMTPTADGYSSSQNTVTNPNFVLGKTYYAYFKSSKKEAVYGRIVSEGTITLPETYLYYTIWVY